MRNISDQYLRQYQKACVVAAGYWVMIAINVINIWYSATGSIHGNDVVAIMLSSVVTIVLYRGLCRARAVAINARLRYRAYRHEVEM